MSSGIEAVGDLASGAAWARTVEPAAGDATPRVAPAACLNCGTTLVGHYCHACGQSGHVHRTLMSMVHDLLHGVFHFEGKIWRTVPMLVLHPGQLTRRYIDGERARFVSPLALFLFTVFLTFATFSTVQSGDMSSGLIAGLTDSAAQLDQTRARTAGEIAAATRERARLIQRGQSTAGIDRLLAKQREDAAALATVRAHMTTAGGEHITVHSSSTWLDDRLREARRNPGLVLYKVQSAAYKFSWVLIFLSTPLVALLFLWRRRFGLYDHATFVTYSISFMSLFAVVLTLLGAIGAPDGLIAPLIGIVPLAHIFSQLRGTYSLRWYGALWRTAVLAMGAFLMLALFVAAVVVLEVAH